MKFDFFINENDSVSESFYVTMIDNNLYYGDNLDEVRKNYIKQVKSNSEDIKESDIKINDIIKQESLEKIEVTFKYPDFKTSIYILSKCISPTEDLSSSKFDFIKFTELRLYFLLKDWNICDKNGKVEVSPENISSLNPSMVEAILLKLNKCIKVHKIF